MASRVLRGGTAPEGRLCDPTGPPSPDLAFSRLGGYTLVGMSSPTPNGTQEHDHSAVHTPLRGPGSRGVYE